MDFNDFQEKTPGAEGGGDASDDFSFDEPDRRGGQRSDDFGFDDDTTSGPPADEPAAAFDFNAGEPGTPREAMTGSTSFFGFFGKGLQMAMLKGDAAEEVAGDPGAFVPALVIYLLPSTIIGLALFAIVNIFAGAATDVPPQFAMAMPFIKKLSVGLVVLLPLMSLIGSIVSVGVLHLVARLFKGEGGYLDYYQTLGVAGLVGWGAYIPYIGFLFSLWLIPVMVVATSRVHNLSTGRSVAVVLLPMVLMLLLVIALISMAGMAAFLGMGAQ